ncbi:MAG: DNA-processing protein DprA [Eubacteriales bacterium]|nr:DNA-processing protein DprA [Eubacteriales bacterium]
MEQLSDTMNLAMAIHLTFCQRRLNIRHAELRKLTDVHSDLSHLMQLDLDAIVSLLTGEKDNRGDDFSDATLRIQSRAESLHQALHDRVRQREAIALARQSAHLAITPVLSGDPFFPEALHDLNTCPALLYVRGSRLPEMLATDPWVTVIGTRRPTVYGQKVTRKITTDLCQRGAVIVSGLARGIDTLAHQIALKSQGLTVGVIASGHDFDYPPENADLIAEMASQGVVLSEHPPGVPPVRQNFPARNRLLSGLSKAVAVMEAAQKSGTLITTTYAADQNREVFAVPGSILDLASAGCHQLIREGAHVLESADDILLLCGLERQISWLEPVKLPGVALKERELALILHVVRIQDLTMDEIVAEIPAPAHETIARVAVLELQGYLTQNRGRYALTELGDSSI